MACHGHQWQRQCYWCGYCLYSSCSITLTSFGWLNLWKTSTAISTKVRTLFSYVSDKFVLTITHYHLLHFPGRWTHPKTVLVKHLASEKNGTGYTFRPWEEQQESVVTFTSISTELDSHYLQEANFNLDTGRLLELHLSPEEYVDVKSEADLTDRFLDIFNEQVPHFDDQSDSDDDSDSADITQMGTSSRGRLRPHRNYSQLNGSSSSTRSASSSSNSHGGRSSSPPSNNGAATAKRRRTSLNSQSVDRQ